MACSGDLVGLRLLCIAQGDSAELLICLTCLGMCAATSVTSFSSSLLCLSVSKPSV